MKKIMNAPVVLFDRFDNEDIIVTSDPVSAIHPTVGGQQNFVEDRESIWD